MSENNKKYEDMELDDLESIHNQISAILDKRRDEILSAIKNRSIDELEEALKNNKNRRLPQRAWKDLSFADITEKDIDFFLYMRNLPEYKINDYQATRAYGLLLTLTEEAVHNGLYNTELFDFFINHQELSNNLKDIIESRALADDIPMEIIKKMFDMDLLNTEEDFLNEIISSEYDNYIEYVLESSTFNLKPEHYQNIYSTKWCHTNDKILSLVKENYPEYTKIPLDILVETISENLMFDDEDRVQTFIKFCGLEKNLFSSVIETHPFTVHDLRNMAQVFNLNDHEHEKFKKLMEVSVNKYPAYLEEVKDEIFSKRLKPVFNTYLNYASLAVDLEVKGDTPKKLKI